LTMRYHVYNDSDTPQGNIELPASEQNGEELIEALEREHFLDDCEADELDVECYDTKDHRIAYTIMDGEYVVLDVLPDGLSPADMIDDDESGEGEDDDPDETVIEAEEFHELE
jgi:hypothetical protein